MGLLSTEVEVGLSNNVKYYEDLGYEIPREIKRGKLHIPQGSKLKVKIEDLPKASNCLVDVQCDCCGKIYQSVYYNYNKALKDGKIYCVLCYRKLFCSGENHPNWNFNLTPENREKSRWQTEGYMNFLANVIKRDKYTCQCCGAMKKLNVHHLNGYNWFVEGRVDPNNAVTLCEDCHKNFHHIYGMKDNTLEQFNEWIGYTYSQPKDILIFPIAKKIYCIEENKIYNSVNDLAKSWGIKESSTSRIYDCCNHKRSKKNSENQYPQTIHGKHLLWYKEYLNMSPEEINEYVKNNKSNKKKVMCIETNEIFNSIAEASQITQVNCKAIIDCCKNKKEYYKTKDGVIMHWIYYNTDEASLNLENNFKSKEESL